MLGVKRLVRLRSRKDGAWLAPPELRARLVDEATLRGVSLSDVVIEKMAVAHSVTVEPRRPTPGLVHQPPRATTDVLDITVPAALDRAVTRRAASRRVTVPRQIIETLAASYGLTVPPRPSRPRARAAAPVTPA